MFGAKTWNWLILSTLILGTLLRVFAAVLSIDIIHPDEHFQTLEQAGRLVYGYGWKSWEWEMGTRSWFVPGLYVPLMALLKVLGINGGVPAIVLPRIFTALASSWVLWRFKKTLEVVGISGVALLGGVAAFAFTPACVRWAPTTLSDTWALIFLWGAMPFVLSKVRSENKSDWAWSGFLIGLVFLTRIQAALWALGILVVVAFFGKKYWYRLGYAAMGYVGALLIQGVLDWATWGRPFQSLIGNVSMNFFKNAANTYGTSPWYQYFPLISENIGIILLAVLLLPFLVALVTGRYRPQREDYLILTPALFVLLGHMLIAHKEVRFLLPIYPVFFYIFALGLHAFSNYVQAAFSTRIGVVMVGLSLISGASAAASLFSRNPQHLFSLADLGAEIRQDGGLSAPGTCLLLIDHYWVWTRGELMEGRPVRFVEASLSQGIPTRALQECAYAVMPAGREARFQAAGGSAWVLLARDQHGQFLFKNTRVVATSH